MIVTKMAFVGFSFSGGGSTNVAPWHVPGRNRQFRARFDDFFRRQMRRLPRRGRCEWWSPAAEANDTGRQTQTGSVYNWWVTVSQHSAGSVDRHRPRSSSYLSRTPCISTPRRGENASSLFDKETSALSTYEKHMKIKQRQHKTPFTRNISSHVCVRTRKLKLGLNNNIRRRK